MNLGRRTVCGSMSVLITAAALVGSSAAAQPAATSPQAGLEAEGETALADIVVTARRREERAQDVPVAITALSAKALERANVTRVEDISRLAPGFVVQPGPLGNGALFITLRSQRQSQAALTFDPAVGVYFAEVPVVRTQGANGSLYDLSSVQVLRGPQGTLFGRNTTGGALLLSPTTPGDVLEGYAKGAIGDYATRQVEGAVTLPVAEGLSIRVAGRHSERDGYIEVLNSGRRVADENIDAFRISARAEPTDDLANLLVVDYLAEKDSGTAFKLIDVVPGSVADTRFGALATLNTLRNRDYYTTATTVRPDGNDIKSWIVSNITTADVGPMTLKNIAGYRRLRSRVSTDYGATIVPFLGSEENLRVTQISDEVQVLGNAFDGSLDYIAGAFFFDESGSAYQITNTAGTIAINDIDVINRSYSGFAQLTWRTPLEGLSLTAGGRQTWDRRDMTTRSTRLGICRIVTADVGGVPLNPCEKTINAKFDAFTYNLSADWKVNEDVLAYIAHRKGYRSGGIPNAGGLPSELVPFRPEIVKDIELGMKANWTLGSAKGRTNIALYKNNYTDIQRLFGFTAPTSTPGVFVSLNSVLNAADATIKGFEIEQDLWLLEGLQLSIGYAFSDARYNRFVLPSGQDYTKSDFAGAPRHTVTGMIRYTAALPSAAGELALQLSGSYRSETVNADVSSFNLATGKNLPTSVIPGYGTVDARIEWNDVWGKNLSLAAFGRNITNEQYITASVDIRALGTASAVLGTPRTFGIEARYDF